MADLLQQIKAVNQVQLNTMSINQSIGKPPTQWSMKKDNFSKQQQIHFQDQAVIIRSRLWEKGQRDQ
jgi:hypothetical protein